MEIVKKWLESIWSFCTDSTLADIKVWWLLAAILVWWVW